MFPTAKIEGLRKITLCVFLGPTLYAHVSTNFEYCDCAPTPFPPPPQKKINNTNWKKNN